MHRTIRDTNQRNIHQVYYKLEIRRVGLRIQTVAQQYDTGDRYVF